MIFKPGMIASMWDTWLYHMDGTCFLYYLARGATWAEGVALSTSVDGVHWQEVGEVFHKDDGAVGMGTGSVWRSAERAGERKFIMNYSIWFDRSICAQTIRFAESRDLVHWTKLGPQLEFKSDPLFYETFPEFSEARWDCIYAMPREGGGYLGYWTAYPTAFYPGFGFGESEDGVRWKALPPPRIEWGDRGPMPRLEIGAVEKIGNTHFAIVGSYSAPCYGGRSGMFLLTADAPERPFRPARKNFEILRSPRTFKMSYFARFFPSPWGLLVHHQSLAKGQAVYFAPFKRADVDAEGTLRLKWWEGNEVLKGARREVAVSRGARGDTARFLDGSLLLDPGFILEGRIRQPARVKNGGAERVPGIFVEEQGGAGIVFLFQEDGTVRIGALQPETGAFRQHDSIDRALAQRAERSFRLLVRHSLAELYLDDFLIQCWSFAKEPTGRIALVGDAAAWEPVPLAAWEMNP